MKEGASVVVAGRHWGRLRFFVKPDLAAVVIDDGTREREIMVHRSLVAPASRTLQRKGAGAALGECGGGNGRGRHNS